MISRRQLLRLAGAAVAAPVACGRRSAGPAATWLNDVHSRLNPTRVSEVVRPTGLEELAAVLARAAEAGVEVSMAGGRHAMGGQQFGAGTLHVDTRGLDRVLAFDRESGTVQVEAGIQWPALVEACQRRAGDRAGGWSIRQKQTGADRMTLGGSLAANVHGRGLTLQPIVGDVESLALVDATGELRKLSREQDPERFGLAIGGYGLFGVIYSVTLRLARRQRLQRVVEVRSANDLAGAFQQRIDDGFRFGDFQFMTDETADGFLRRGVFSCYRPAPPGAGDPGRRRRLPRRAWQRLLGLAHTDKRQAWELYSRYYLATDGQLYWSDTHQLAAYLDDYHAALDREAPGGGSGSEMITELYVPRAALGRFLERAADELRRARANVIYGTIRLIEPESDTFLAWARGRLACVVVNLHVDHHPDGLARARDEFRMLIDLALEQGGGFYLTYHRWATRPQVEAAYPGFSSFLDRKRELDPEERWVSDWYRHYRRLFA